MKNILSKEKIDEIHNWCEYYGMENHTINRDGSIDVTGDVDIHSTKMDNLPYKFNIINGVFIAEHLELKNLKNSPNVVNGFVNVSSNKLTTLEGCPRYIKDDFYFNANPGITSTYVGDYDVIIEGNIIFYNTNIDNFFLEKIIATPESDSFKATYDHDKLRVIFKYQRHYEIWDHNQKLIRENYLELLNEINDGLL